MASSGGVANLNQLNTHLLTPLFPNVSDNLRWPSGKENLHQASSKDSVVFVYSELLSEHGGAKTKRLLASGDARMRKIIMNGT